MNLDNLVGQFINRYGRTVQDVINKDSVFQKLPDSDKEYVLNKLRKEIKLKENFNRNMENNKLKEYNTQVYDEVEILTGDHKGETGVVLNASSSRNNTVQFDNGEYFSYSPNELKLIKRKKESIISFDKEQKLNCLKEEIILEKGEKIKIVEAFIYKVGDEVKTFDGKEGVIEKVDYSVEDKNAKIPMYQVNGEWYYDFGLELKESVQLKERYDLEDIAHFATSEPGISSKTRGLLKFLVKNQDSLNKDDIKNFLDWYNTEMDGEIENADYVIKSKKPSDTGFDLPSDDWNQYR